MNTMTPDLQSQFWEPSRALTLAAANRHTAFIKAFKIFCLLTAASLIAVLAYFVVDGPNVLTPQEALETDTVRMTNPRYTGLDGDGVPYNLTADYALREIDNPDAVRLINPVLGFSRLEGVDLSTVIAKEGIYDNVAQTLDLRDDVVVKTDDGYVCTTTHARIVTQDKIVRGDERISCIGNFGNVEGDRYEILDNYSRFVFLDNVKALLLPERESELRGTETPIQSPNEDTP